MVKLITMHTTSTSKWLVHWITGSSHITLISQWPIPIKIVAFKFPNWCFALPLNDERLLHPKWSVFSYLSFRFVLAKSAKREKWKSIWTWLRWMNHSNTHTHSYVCELFFLSTIYSLLSLPENHQRSAQFVLTSSSPLTRPWIGSEKTKTKTKNRKFGYFFISFCCGLKKGKCKIKWNAINHHIHRETF